MRQDGLEAAVSPNSVAVIGASNKKGRVGHAVIKNILNGGYTGKVYAVNPSSKAVMGIKCYRRVTEIPGPVDLAVVIVPSRIVPDAIEDCGHKEIKCAVIISAGFKETGNEGKMLEERVAKIAMENGVRIIGPNCVGIINSNPQISLNASFTKRKPKFGNVSLISQSGAICGAMLEYAKIKEVGFSKVFSLGNKADVNENDVLNLLSKDSSTKVILMYVEDLVNAKEFIRIASNITRRGVKSKPILVMKAGRSPIGTKAIASHTGALAGSYEAYEAIFKQAGILKTETLEQLFDYALAFSYQPLPHSGGCAVISNAGGPAAIIADASAKHGLKIAKLSEKTLDELKTILPKNAMLINPIDMIGDSDHLRYQKVLRSVLKDKEVSSCIVISTPQLMLDINALAEVIVKTKKEFESKTILACITSFMEDDSAVRILDEHHIPQYAFPESAVSCLATMQHYVSISKRPISKIKKYHADSAMAKKIIEMTRRDNLNYIFGAHAMKILSAYGIPVVEPFVTKNPNECILAANRIGYPVVLKISSPDIVHKVDVGGVELNLRDVIGVRRAFRKIINSVKTSKPKARINGITVERFIEDGKEMIIGSKRDPQFGPLLMFGSGGIYVNIFNDVSFRLAPVTEFDANQMIDSTKASKILSGVRGGKPRDRASITDCLMRMSQMVTDIPEILEIDINPLLVFEKGRGCMAVDTRIVIS